jgi:FlaG/FlaF family flagellin (archaellin)
MRRVLLGFTLLTLTAILLLAANDAVGTWDVTSATSEGSEMNWTLVIKDDGGTLTGTISGEPGDFTLEDVKLDGHTLTFKTTIDSETYTTEAKISGSKLEGSYKGTAVKGTLKGTKKS